MSNRTNSLPSCQVGRLLLPPTSSPLVDPLFRFRTQRWLQQLVQHYVRDPGEYASELEQELAIQANFFGALYEQKVCRLCYALQKRPDLSISATPRALAAATDEDLDPEGEAELQRRSEARTERRETFMALVDAMNTYIEEKGCVGLRCRRCDGRVQFDPMQTRSGDEPMTIFCVCLSPKCGQRWKL